MSPKRILSVGQCAADHQMIAQALDNWFSVEIQPAATTAEAIEKLREGGFALLLVNRIFDANGSPGLEFIKHVKEDPQLRTIPAMLVSNHEEYQQQAVAAGAVPGFGKGALADPATRMKLNPFLAR